MLIYTNTFFNDNFSNKKYVFFGGGTFRFVECDVLMIYAAVVVVVVMPSQFKSNISAIRTVTMRNKYFPVNKTVRTTCTYTINT